MSLDPSTFNKHLWPIISQAVQCTHTPILHDIVLTCIKSRWKDICYIFHSSIIHNHTKFTKMDSCRTKIRIIYLCVVFNMLEIRMHHLNPARVRKRRLMEILRKTTINHLSLLNFSLEHTVASRIVKKHCFWYWIK